MTHTIFVLDTRSYPTPEMPPIYSGFGVSPELSAPPLLATAPTPPQTIAAPEDVAEPEVVAQGRKRTRVNPT